MNSAGPVITGFGAISPLGATAWQMWQQLCRGQCGIDKITAFDASGFTCRIAGQVPDFNVKKYVPKNYRKAVKLMSRDIELSIVASHEAFSSSGLVTKAIDPENVNIEPTRTAINFGAGLISCELTELGEAISGSVTDGEFDLQKWGSQAIQALTPLWLLKYLPNMLACHVGIIHDIQGPSNTITCAEVSGYLSIAEAADIISRGSGDVALAGGVEAKVNPVVLIRQCLLKRAATSRQNRPETACRPFDADADGSVFGEAAGAVILEDRQKANRRGARIYARIAGTGQSNNINPAYEHLEPDGKGIRIAIEKALEDAAIKPEQLDLIIPHGTGIPQDDLAEARAIEAVLGSSAAKIPVWPTKSMLSNTGAACGALDIIAAICVMNEGLIPAAKNFDTRPAGCNLNISVEPQKRHIRYALCCGYTYAGQTAAVVLKNDK